MRTTVYLDDEVRSQLERLVPARRLSKFVNQALREKLAALEQSRVEAAMQEGYLFTDRDQADVDEDWALLDTEHWPR